MKLNLNILKLIRNHREKRRQKEKNKENITKKLLEALDEIEKLLKQALLLKDRCENVYRFMKTDNRIKIIAEKKGRSQSRKIIIPFIDAFYKNSISCNLEAVKKSIETIANTSIVKTGPHKSAINVDAKNIILNILTILFYYVDYFTEKRYQAKTESLLPMGFKVTNVFYYPWHVPPPAQPRKPVQPPARPQNSLFPPMPPHQAPPPPTPIRPQPAPPPAQPRKPVQPPARPHQVPPPSLKKK